MTVANLFELNSKIVEEIATDCITACPKACILVVTQPVDCLTPLVGQLLHDSGIDSKSQVIGATASNIARASHVLAQSLRCNPGDIVVPVIGGHCVHTIIPVFSACSITSLLTDPVEVEMRKKQLALYQSADPPPRVKKLLEEMVFLVKYWDSWVIGPMEKDHSGTFTGAMTAASTTINIIKGLKHINQSNIDHGFVESDVIPGLSHSTVPLTFGPDGVKECLPVPILTTAEKDLFRSGSMNLKRNIMKGRQFAMDSHMKNMCGIQ